MPNIRVQAEPFDTGAEIAALLAGQTQIGGIGCFVGTVRDTARRPPPSEPLLSSTTPA